MQTIITGLVTGFVTGFHCRESDLEANINHRCEFWLSGCRENVVGVLGINIGFFKIHLGPSYRLSGVGKEIYKPITQKRSEFLLSGYRGSDRLTQDSNNSAGH